MYLDQFGSFRVEPDTTCVVLLAVQRGAKVSFRVVNLLDEESDEDVPPSPPKVSPVEGSKHPLQAVHEEIPPSVKDVDREEGKNAPAGGSDDDGGRGDSVGPPKDSSVLLAIDVEKAQEAEGTSSHLIGARDRFSELGTPSISRRLAFQGPDIDPYLRYALQVDVANVMKELRELLGLEPPETGTSQVVSKSQPALPEDVESFDAEGKVLQS